MDKLKLSLTILLAVLFTTAFLSVTYAQNTNLDVHIVPEEAEIDLGESIKLDAFAFSLSSAANAPVKIAAITWDVEPDSMGTITDDGFFIAGRRVGIVKINVTIDIGNQRIVRVVCIRIGRLPKPFFDVKIVPNGAVVAPGTEQQFEVVVTSLNGQVRPQNVQWEIKPEDLGKISEEGLFAAGDRDGRGKVVAVVQLDGLRIPTSADVIVHDPPTGAISGNISNDADSSPIGSAVVKAVRLGRIRWIQRTESDDAGNYVLDNLIPGRYILYANARGFIGEFYANTRDYLQAFVLTVAEDDTVTDKDFGLSEGAKIAGTVVTDSDTPQPLANAHVVAFLKLNPRVAKHATTNDDGAYEIGELETGAYLVAANAPGYGAEFFDHAKDLADARILNVQEPKKVEDIDFALGMASAIRGVVRNAADQEPIAGAHVRVFSHSPNAVRPDNRVFRETRTNENGEYLVQVRPGSYLVSASAEGFNTQFHDHAADREDATLVKVESDSHTADINFDLTKRGSIAGKVTNQAGDPLAGAIVQAFKESSNSDRALSIAGFRAKTDDEGNYLIGNVPSGKYIVLAAAEEYLPEFWEEVPTKDLAKFVDVTDGESKEAINFTLDPGGCISGTVVSTIDNLPVVKALVQVWAADSKHGRRTFTDENGEYKVGGLATGSHLVQVIADGFHAQFYETSRTRDQADLVEVTAPNETSGIDLFLHPKEDRRGTITGRVFSDADDTPLFGGVVIAVSPRDRIPHIAFSGPRGHYKLTDLPPGRYYMFAWARGFVGEFFKDTRRFRDADPVSVENEQVAEGIDFGLRPRHRNGTYTVHGRIRGAANNMPLQGILVRAISGDGDVEVNAVTDANGDYSLIELPAGDYRIDASGVGFEDGYFGGTNEQNASSITVGNGQDFEGANMNLGEDNITSVSDGDATVPEAFDLSQNYPNPFNPETQIKYQLSENSQVTLKIFNLLGQEVITLVNQEQPIGVYTVQWNGKDSFGRQAATGVYIYQMKAGDKFVMSKPMLLLK